MAPALIDSTCDFSVKTPGSGKSVSVPTVQCLPSNAPLQDVIAAIKSAGGVVIRDFLTKEMLAQMEEEVRPQLEADEAWDGM